jgi:hypothetical protein
MAAPSEARQSEGWRRERDSNPIQGLNAKIMQMLRKWVRITDN